MSQEYAVNKPEEFRKPIEDILKQHKTSGTEPLVITLQGDLGAGKTTFTQELGRYVGVTEPITSPTFTIMKQYELSRELFDTLIHIDAYRFETEDEARPLRLDEIFSTPRTIICIEWPERIPSRVPKKAVSITITITKGEERRVIVRLPEEDGREG